MILNLKYNILIIDDHPLIIEGYKLLLDYCEFDFEKSVITVNNSKEAFDILDNNPLFNLVLIDYSIQIYKEKNIYSGIDLAKIVLNKIPYAKIVFITSSIETFILFEIKSKINPQGIIIKSDLSSDELISAFQLIINGNQFFSKNVLTQLNKIYYDNKNIFFDYKNREIIKLLSMGLSNKSISYKLGISISSIEKRKRKIKEYLNLNNSTDHDMLVKIKELKLL
ncbi:response regulator transcription factor [Flavobacterium urocaniciphilum]|uniref:Two component transcriptional regulator, LuxR family n=1 Tax=Flavobacterium urocaniciphilum TaxID=1299341 RepID=A0A1H8ZPB0_9FLAO|nr:response regulator transcription factor [Flavobacterium urocaniciphilum]SEP66280.1 two component transcriptional regulator, LuxR family [Flavobacterium urocaniciphilum]